MSETPVLQCSGIKKRFGKQQILHGIDLTVNKGDIVGLLGPNGAGKSTLLKIATGLVWPDEGEVSIHGHDVHTKHQQAMSRTGAIIEWPYFVPYLSAVQNIRMLCGRSDKAFDALLTDTLSFVDMLHAKDKKVGTFSTGMKQRLGIALALLPNSETIILDEPTNGLDPNGIIDVRELILRRNKEYGTTVLLSSHLLNEVEKLCQKLVVIYQGRVVAAGSMDELLSEFQCVEINTDDNTVAREHLLHADGAGLNIESIETCANGLSLKGIHAKPAEINAY